MGKVMLRRINSQQQLNDYSNQNNPSNITYQNNLDNHADKCNPINEDYQG